MKELSPKQRRFVAEYLKDQNASQAAVRAGYRNRPDVAGPRLMVNEGIRRAIEAKISKIEKQVEVSIVDVIRELKTIAFLDLRKAFDKNGKLLPPHQWPDDIAHALSSVDSEELFEGVGGDRERIGDAIKVKMHSKTESIKMLGQYLKMFTDRVEHDFADGVFERLERGRSNATKPSRPT